MFNQIFSYRPNFKGPFKQGPNFKQGHYIYIVGTIIIGAIVMYPVKNAKFIDILFTSVASCTQSGLNTYDLCNYELYQQIVIYIIATTTTPIVIHGSMLFVRLHRFERHFQDIKTTSLMNHRARRMSNCGGGGGDGDGDGDGDASGTSGDVGSGAASGVSNAPSHTESLDNSKYKDGTNVLNNRAITVQLPQQVPFPHTESDNESICSETTEFNITPTKSANYLSYHPLVGKNSTFINLTKEQKEELGGVEYRAVKVLIKILIVYYIGFHLLALVVYVSWINTKPKQMELIREIGVSPNWWGAFIGQSAFNNLGYSLTPNSLANFSQEAYPQIWGVFFIVCGHTGFPIMLRLIIWIMFKLTKINTLLHESLGFLLDHPRRVFTFLFPKVATWYLVGILVILNGLDLLFFMVLDLNNKTLDQIPTGYRVLCGIFQAFTTRTAGLSVIDISTVRSAVQLSYMIMMYISVLPIAMTVRSTNVYEEQALGIYRKNRNIDDYDDTKASTFISTHVKKQLAFDLWFIALMAFIICIADMNKLENDALNFNIFKIFFEIFSAYGTVGLSLGYPGFNASFSAQFSTISKLIICLVMIRGRHRGLPYTLDRAIMLPNEKMERYDEIQEEAEMERIVTGQGGGERKSITKEISRRCDSLFNI